MNIYKDHISDALGIRPMLEVNSEFKNEFSLPKNSKEGNFSFKGPHTEETKKLMSQTRTGEGNSFYGKKHVNPKKCTSYGMLNKKHSEETKEKMSKSAMGKPGTNNGKVFGPRTEEQRKRISEATKKAMKNLPKRVHKKVCCPYCNKEGGGSNMTRYHFDNCKLKNV